MLSVLDPETVGTVEVLEKTAERFLVAARRDDVPAATAKRWSSLGDELSSHALAARVLVTSGASQASLRIVLERAVAILDDVHDGGDLEA